MSLPRSHHKKQWVWIQFSSDDEPLKAFIRKVTFEASIAAYDLHWEDGRREIVFANSVHRLWPVNPKKGVVIDFAKRRLKRLRVV